MIYWFARTFSFFLGFFLLLTLGLSIITFHHAIWWFDLTLIPNGILRTVLVLVFSLALLSLAFSPPKKRWQQIVVFSILFIFLCFAVNNTISYYHLLAKKQIYAGPLIPFSAFVFFGLLFLMWATTRTPVWYKQAKRTPTLSMIGFLLLLGILFPITQIFCFGRTDYRRTADVIVVFGARTYANGMPSVTLANRVLTACELYKQGYAKTIIFSGGPGDGSIHETEAMKTLALQQGVQPQDILLDKEGINTQATVRNTMKIFENLHIHRVLVVSDFTHLPRIKLTYQLAGQQVYTVPAHGFPKLSLLLFQLGRETIAFWAYYFHIEHLL